MGKPTKPTRGDGGRFTGSIGAGRDKAPTAAPRVLSAKSGAPGVPGESLDEVFERYQATRRSSRRSAPSQGHLTLISDTRIEVTVLHTMSASYSRSVDPAARRVAHAAISEGRLRGTWVMVRVDRNDDYPINADALRDPVCTSVYVFEKQ